MRSALYLGIGCLVLLFGLRGYCAEEVQPNIQKKLVEMWAAEHSAILTGHFKLRYILLPAKRLIDCTASELETLVASVDLTASEQQMKLLYDRISRKPTSSQTPWMDVTLDLDDKRLRQEIVLRNGGRQSILTSVYNNAETIEADSANRQVTVIRGKGCRDHLSFSDIRFVPKFTELQLNGFQLTKDTGRQIRILAKGDSDKVEGELDVDEDTGFIHRLILRNPAGQIEEAILQYGPVTYPGNMVFPTACVHIVCYTNGNVHRIAIIVIEEAVLNEPIRDEVFRVAVPPKTVIVDATRSGVSPIPFRTKEPVGDVAAFVINRVSHAKISVMPQVAHDDSMTADVKHEAKDERGDAKKAEHVPLNETTRRWSGVAWLGMAIVILSCGYLTLRYWPRFHNRSSGDE